MSELASEFEIGCPCCSSTLVIDADLRRLISHRRAPRADTPEIEDAQRILAAEAARREAVFEQAVSDEKERSDALSRRFEEALKRAAAEPVTRPPRDFDVD